MAVFMLNVCKFNGCGLTFKSLGHLIQHIEETHIDYDPHVVEQTELQQPTCIPLSYALRFLTDAARKECAKSASQGKLNQSNTIAASARNRNNAATPTGSEAEEGDEFASEPDDSNDSWTTSEEFSADFILRYGSRVMNQSVPNPSNNNIINSNGNNNNNSSSSNNSIDKPFACPVPGCKKRYKNVNGIKYHSKNGHKKDGNDNKSVDNGVKYAEKKYVKPLSYRIRKVPLKFRLIRKAFRCPCGKSYKTPSGLKNHATIQHAGSILQNGKIPSIKYDNRTVHHHNHHHHHHHNSNNNHQQRDNLSKSIASTGIPMKVGKHSLAKVKIAAIEDHGYIKSDKSMYTESSETSMIRECDEEELGVLTPASTPPLPSQSPAKNDITLSNQQHDKTLQKYLANVAATNNNNQQRRNVAENNNAY